MFTLHLHVQLKGASINHVRGFLGHFFLLVQMISIFACGLRLHRKTYPPYFSWLVSVSFFRNNVCKMHFFSWWCPFQTKLLFFQTIESVKYAFASGAGLEKPALLHALFSKTNNKTTEKNIVQWFPIKPNITCKNLTHFKPQPLPIKEQLKKSLTMFIHAHLQL